MQNLIRCVILLICVSKVLTLLGDVQIKDFILTNCDNTNNEVFLTNVNVQIVDGSHVRASGTLITEVNLISPIKADVILKKKVSFLWIEIPCEKQLGSCTYWDLCTFGYPNNKTCPSYFIQNNVPCRCPISAGNYTLPPAYKIMQEASIITGKYKGIVQLSHLSEKLGCYYTSFTLI